MVKKINKLYEALYTKLFHKIKEDDDGNEVRGFEGPFVFLRPQQNFKGRMYLRAPSDDVLYQIITVSGYDPTTKTFTVVVEVEGPIGLGQTTSVVTTSVVTVQCTSVADWSGHVPNLPNATDYEFYVEADFDTAMTALVKKRQLINIQLAQTTAEYRSAISEGPQGEDPYVIAHLSKGNSALQEMNELIATLAENKYGKEL